MMGLRKIIGRRGYILFIALLVAFSAEFSPFLCFFFVKILLVFPFSTSLVEFHLFLYFKSIYVYD